LGEGVGLIEVEVHLRIGKCQGLRQNNIESVKYSDKEGVYQGLQLTRYSKTEGISRVTTYKVFRNRGVYQGLQLTRLRNCKHKAKEADNYMVRTPVCE